MWYDVSYKGSVKIFIFQYIQGALNHELDHALDLPLLVTPATTTIAVVGEIINLENLLRSIVRKCENYLKADKIFRSISKCHVVDEREINIVLQKSCVNVTSK